MIRKVHQPRYRANGPLSDPPMATFYPKTSTRYTSRASPLFMRKWRGLRIRGKGWACKRDKAIEQAFIFLGWK